MSLKKQRQGQIGVNVVERVVLSEWNARWQSIDAHNDDGIDGLIFLEKGGELSGQIVFAQVKCVKTKLRSDKKFAVPINSTNLSRKLSAWRRIVGAAIVILVDPVDFSARWVDIKSEGASTESQIIVPENQLFNRTALGCIKRLCGSIHQDLQAQKIHTFADDFFHLRSHDHLQKSSRSLYISLHKDPVYLARGDLRIHFDRDGWRHITRPRRSQLSKYQSFALLGAARKILECYNGNQDDFLRNYNVVNGSKYFQIDSMVTFPFRQTGLVRLVIREFDGTLSQKSKLKFWTLYEPRRKHSTMGVQEPRHL